MMVEVPHVPQLMFAWLALIPAAISMMSSMMNKGGKKKSAPQAAPESDSGLGLFNGTPRGSFFSQPQSNSQLNPTLGSILSNRLR